MCWERLNDCKHITSKFFYLLLLTPLSNVHSYAYTHSVNVHVDRPMLCLQYRGVDVSNAKIIFRSRCGDSVTRDKYCCRTEVFLDVKTVNHSFMTRFKYCVCVACSMCVRLRTRSHSMMKKQFWLNM